MTMIERSLPYINRASMLSDAIGELEGWTFGGSLRFSGHGDKLSFSLNDSWQEAEKFCHLPRLPGVRQFAEDLEKAIQPIRAKYALSLRQELANELLRVAAIAIEGQ